MNITAGFSPLPGFPTLVVGDCRTAFSSRARDIVKIKAAEVREGIREGKEHPGGEVVVSDSHAITIKPFPAACKSMQAFPLPSCGRQPLRAPCRVLWAPDALLQGTRAGGSQCGAADP